MAEHTPPELRQRQLRVWFLDEQLKRLSHAAVDRGVTAAELVRQGVELVLAQEAPKKPSK